MSEYADILAVERKVEDGITSTEVRVDLGGGDIGTADHVADAGDDSHPLPGIDEASVDESTGAGNLQAAGYFDRKNPPKTAPGEKRIYGRDPDTGEEVCEFWLKNTGEIQVTVLKPGAAIRITSDGPVIVDSPDVRLGSEGGGKQVACVGDLVAVVVPNLSNGSGACLPTVNPTAVTPSGDYIAAGQIISGRSNVKAGP